MGQALPAIDTELPVFDGMRLESFPVDGSSRAVLLARIAPDALFLIDLNKGQAVRLYPCFGHIEFVFDMSITTRLLYPPSLIRYKKRLHPGAP